MQGLDKPPRSRTSYRMIRSLAVLALLALAACGGDPDVGVGIGVGSDGVKVRSSVSGEVGNVSVGARF